MKHRIFMIALCSLWGMPSAHADGMPEAKATAVYTDGASELPVDNRIKLLNYTPTDVYTVPTKYGYQTSIVFESGEAVRTVSVGDRSMWQIVPSGNRIFIRPMDDDLSTNMTVITNMREYNFDIKSVAADKTNNVYVIQFRYPEDERNSDAPELPPIAPAVSRIDAVAIPPLDTQRTQSINKLYSYTGPDEVAPAQVYDDGKNTYVVYNTIPSPAPKPLITSASGNQDVATHVVQGNKIVIRTVTSGFVLTSPAGDITVYNELFHP